MARKGPPPKPTELRIADGSHLPRNALEPQARSGVPAMPKWLSRGARSDWKYVAKVLKELGCVTKADGLLLALLVDNVYRYRHCARVVDEKGMVAIGKYGEKTRPEAMQMTKHLDAIIKIASRFGLSPSDRVNLIDETKRADQERDAEFFGRQPA